MKYHQMTRLFVPFSLQSEMIILSTLADVHYLIKVMRKKKGDQLLIFNQQDGEYIAEITEIGNKNIVFKRLEQTKFYQKKSEINLIFAPIKQSRMSFLLEKTTELGVSKLIPVQTKHSVVDKINLSKWQIYLKEAAEQCGRLDLPEIKELQSFDKFIAQWPVDQLIILCNESEQSLPLIKALQDKTKDIIINIMIGPEGGFSAQEISILKQKSFVQSVHLGPRILRAETAAIAALATSQGLLEDF